MSPDSVPELAECLEPRGVLREVSVAVGFVEHVPAQHRGVGGEPLRIFGPGFALHHAQAEPVQAVQVALAQWLVCVHVGESGLAKLTEGREQAAIVGFE